MARRFITKVDIDRLLAEGKRTLEVDGDTTVTDHAKEFALARGVTITRTGSPARTSPPATEDRAAVRSAVIAALGTVPQGLDSILDRVLGEHPGS
ncbi:MAG: hypothetical protein GXY39_06625 [Actinomycetales bacterium]|nr:hypothetical protein [Actinomycetales bacterium]